MYLLNSFAEQLNLFFLSTPFWLLLIAIALTGLIGFIWKKRERIDLIIGPKGLGATDEGLKLFYAWVPVILGLHVGSTLLINGLQGNLFISANKVPEGISNAVGLGEIFIALSLFYGGLTRISAILIALLWLAGIFILGLIPMLGAIQYLGYATFFYFAGRGPYSIDRLLMPNLEPTPSYANQALLLLRIAVGLNLIFFGMTTKFANIPFTNALMNISLVIGFIEILGGMLIIFGIFQRTVALITLICVNTSLTIYNWNFLVDYLPIYAALAIMLVWEPYNYHQKLMWVEGLRKNIPPKVLFKE